jgi:site-specific DNA recombinase
VDEVEAQHVRAMYRWVLEEGLSSRAVAKRLNELEVKPRRAQLWSQGGAYSILTNPAYTGLAAYNRWEAIEPKRPRNPGSYRHAVKSSKRLRAESEWGRVPIPPLVDEETQRKVRAILSRHKIASKRNVKHQYLLRTLVVCGECGWRMECAHDQRRPNYEYFYYACRHVDPLETGHETRCRARRVRRDELDQVVWETVAAWLQQPEMLIREVQAWRSSQAGAAQLARDRAQAEKAERHAVLQIERLVDAYQRGALGVDELKARRERLEAARTAARLRVEDLLATEMDRSRLEAIGDDLVAFASTLRSGLDQLDFEGRQRLVRLLVERVVVTGTHVAIEHAIPLSGRFDRLQQHRLPGSMPLDHRGGLDDDQRVPPTRPPAREQHPKPTVYVGQPRPLDRAFEDAQLMAQRQDLDGQLAARSKEGQPARSKERIRFSRAGEPGPTAAQPQ